MGDYAHIKAAPSRGSEMILISGDGAFDRSNDEFHRSYEFNNIQQNLEDLSKIFEKSQEVLLKINRDLIEMQRIQQAKNAHEDVHEGGRKRKSKQRRTNRRRSNRKIY